MSQIIADGTTAIKFRSADRLLALEAHFFSVLERRIAQLEAAGRDVIRLDAGSPDLPPAPHILEALTRAAASPEAHGYQSPRGTPALRGAWAEMYAHAYGVDIDPDINILPLMGSKEGIFHLVQAFVQAGDVVLGPDPGYPSYRQATRFAGGEYYPMPLRAENQYLPDLHAIPRDILRRARLLWLNYPNNPTGAVAPVECLQEAVEFAREHRLLLCHDAAYSQVTFEGYRAPSLLSVEGAEETALEFNSLSKSHNMAGWRVGAALGNQQALQMLHSSIVHVDSGHFRPITQAAAAAMTGDQSWLEARNAIYCQRRDGVVGALKAMKLACAVPQASLYIWFSTPEGWGSEDFANLLLEQASVSLTPGRVFGVHGEGFLRLSLTQPLERINEAMRRMQPVVGEL